MKPRQAKALVYVGWAQLDRLAVDKPWVRIISLDRLFTYVDPPKAATPSQVITMEDSGSVIYSPLLDNDQGTIMLREPRVEGALHTRSQSSAKDLLQVAETLAAQRVWTYRFASQTANIGPKTHEGILRGLLRRRIEHGEVDCDTFVIHALMSAGIDLDRSIQFETSGKTTLRRGAMIHGQTLLRREFKLDSKKTMSGRAKRLALKKLLEKDDPRLFGAPGALVQSLQGRTIDHRSMNALRPGDVVQYWYPSDQGKGVGGHAVIVAWIELKDGTRIDSHTPPSTFEAEVSRVGLLGAHRNDGDPRSNDVRIIEKNLNRFDLRFFAARPVGSRWY